MTDALSELRAEGRGAEPQAEALARGIREKLAALQQAIVAAVVAVDRAGVPEAAHTVAGRLEQARRWLSRPAVDEGGLGRRAIQLVVEEGRRVADGLPGHQKTELLQSAEEVEALCRQLSDMCASGRGDDPAAHELARKLSQRLHDLKERIQSALVGRVVEDFIDIGTPLKLFTEAVLTPEGTPGRDQLFADRSRNLQNFSARAVKTAKMVAAGGSGGNKKLAESLLSAASQVTHRVSIARRFSVSRTVPGGKSHSATDVRRQHPHELFRIESGRRALREPASAVRRHGPARSQPLRRGDRFRRVYPRLRGADAEAHVPVRGGNQEQASAEDGRQHVVHRQAGQSGAARREAGERQFGRAEFHRRRQSSCGFLAKQSVLKFARSALSAIVRSYDS